MARAETNTGFKNSKNRTIFMSKSKTGKVSYFAKSGDKKVYGVKAHTKNGKTIKGNTTVPNKIRPAVRKGGVRGSRAATVVRKMVGGVMKRVTAGNKPSSAMARNARAARKGAMKARGVGGVVRRRVAKAPKSESALATRRFSAMMTKLNKQKAKSDARKVVKARVTARKSANKEAMTATRRFARMSKTLNSQKARAEAAKLRRRNVSAAKALAKEEERASQMFFRTMAANARKAAAAAKKAAARKPKAAPKRRVALGRRQVLKRSTSATSYRPKRANSTKRSVSAPGRLGRKMSKSERSRRAKKVAANMSVSAKARRSQKAANTRKAKKALLNANPFAAIARLVNNKPRRARSTRA